MPFELDFRNIIVLVSLSIHALLLWILYRYGRKTPGGAAYSVAILAIAGWVFPMFLYRSHLFDQTVLWVRLLYLMASFTSTTFLYFTFVWPDNLKVPRWVEILIVLENLILGFVVFHPTWLIQGVQYVQSGEDIILWGPLYIVYVLHISLPLLVGFVILFLKMRKAKGVVRKQILAILIGYFLAGNLAMSTNLILPWMGYFELNWLGQFFSTIIAALTTFAILKHKLMNIKVLVAEGFILILNFFLIIQFIISESTSRFIINGLILLAVLVISYLLIRGVSQEVKRREELAVLAGSLEQANAQLKELDQQKTEFLSIASHQLRTPLSILKGYIELIKDGAYGKVQKSTVRVLGEMDKNNEHLVKLVDEFLDITHIEQGKIKYNFEYQNICEITENVINELRNRATQKGLEIRWACPREKKQVYCDKEKIYNVIFNFLDNAIKYCDKGVIEICLKQEKDGVAIRVKDSGVGFGKSDEASFYQKFYRGNNVKGVNVTGTGLGLYVCRKFIEAHKGKVWAHSEGLGKGSEFGFWVPATKSV